MSESENYVITKVFRSGYSGYCTLDPEHRIKRNDLVGKLGRADNPMLPVTGVACKYCVKHIPRDDS